MKRALVRGLSLAVLSTPFLSLAAASAPKMAAKSAAATLRQDWLRTARRTAEGAIVIGNPAARVKLVEYLSLTCPHCAALSAQMIPALQKDYIAKGLVSLEVRHAVRDGYDFVASLLLRCEPPARYLGAIDALFATQQDWMAKGAGAAATPDFEAKSPDEKMRLVANAAGFDSFFAGRGMTPGAYAACLADGGGKEQLTRMAGNSWQRDAIPGTPLILINGNRQEAVHQWNELEPLIKAALR